MALPIVTSKVISLSLCITPMSLCIIPLLPQSIPDINVSTSHSTHHHHNPFHTITTSHSKESDSILFSVANGRGRTCYGHKRGKCPSGMGRDAI